MRFKRSAQRKLVVAQAANNKKTLPDARRRLRCADFALERVLYEVQRIRAAACHGFIVNSRKFRCMGQYSGRKCVGRGFVWINQNLRAIQDVPPRPSGFCHLGRGLGTGRAVESRQHLGQSSLAVSGWSFAGLLVASW